MEKRKLLTAGLIAFTLIGIGLVSVPFISSLSVSAKSENEAWISCDVAYLSKGKIQKCGLARVYRRTQTDISSIDNYEHLLDDPSSESSTQPKEAINKWRSIRPEYFIFWPASPVMGCPINFKSAGEIEWMNVPERNAMDKLPFFSDPCEVRVWDTSGRLYNRSGNLPEKNMAVPNVRWISDTKVLIYRVWN